MSANNFNFSSPGLNTHHGSYLKLLQRSWLWNKTSLAITQISAPAVGELLLAIALAGARCADSRFYGIKELNRLFFLPLKKKDLRPDITLLLSALIKS